MKSLGYNYEMIGTNIGAFSSIAALLQSQWWNANDDTIQRYTMYMNDILVFLINLSGAVLWLTVKSGTGCDLQERRVAA